MTPEDKYDLGKHVQEVAVTLGDFLAEIDAPVHVGMSALALVLASSAKTCGMSPHETISRFTSSVRAVYKDMEQ